MFAFVIITLASLFMLIAISFELIMAERNLQHWLRRSAQKPDKAGQLLDWLTRALSLPFQDIELSLSYSGMSLSTATRQWLAKAWFPLKFLLTIASVAPVLLFPEQLGLSESSKTLFAAAFAVLFMAGPDILLKYLRKRYTAYVRKKLPVVLELMASCVHTGMTLEATIHYLGQELESYDGIIARLLQQISYFSKLNGLQPALAELENQFADQEIQSFSYTLRQSLQYGSSLGQILNSQAVHLRELDLLELEERAAKLSAKISLPLIMFIMFPLIVLITIPEIKKVINYVS